MDGATTEDWIENARMIVDSARAIVPADGGLDRVRELRFAEAGFDPAIMAQAGELGLFLMRVPEDAGGLGLGMRETCELARVLGRGLLPEPVLSAMMAGALLQDRMPEAAMTGAEVMVTYAKSVFQTLLRAVVLFIFYGFCFVIISLIEFYISFLLF